MTIKIGDKLPAVTLKDQNKADVNVSGIQGKKVLLSFHPLAWTSICADQMKSLEENEAVFKSLNTVALGVSVDTIPSKKAWAEHLGITTTKLLSDFWPHGAFAQELNLFRHEIGTSERANLIIDENQQVIFLKIYDIGTLPDINEIIDFLKESDPIG